jgi:hypothetical protein
MGDKTGIAWTDALRERFWSKVDKRGPDECWLWIGAQQSPGYGRIRIAKKAVYAHRASFELANGYAPGEVVMHTCDNPSCVNPVHLRDATHAENHRDCIDKGRSNQVRGERSGRTSFTDDSVRKIRERLATGDTLRSIAKSFGVGHTTIANIKSGATWGHVL